jgi:hypothetical protein
MSRSKSFFIFSASFLLLALLVDLFSSRIVYSYPLIDDYYYAANQKLHQLNLSDPSDKILILGSSMSREGIDPEILVKDLGPLEIFKFSISKGKPTDFYLIWNKIEEEKREEMKLVIVSLSPWMFAKKLTAQVDEQPGTRVFFDPQAVITLYGKETRNLDWFPRQTIASMSSFYRYGDYIEQMIDHKKLSFWKDSTERAIAKAPPEYRYSKNQPQSYFAEELQNKENYRIYSRGNYNWDAERNVQIRALQYLLAELEQEKIPVMVLDMAVHPYRKHFYESGLEEEYKQLVQSVIPSHARFYDFSSSYEKESFIDFSHLNQKGRQQFSEDLREILEENYAF